jgi:catechol 2,3-dioxygenase-like lactoylglutathione lyase family enzyme
MQALRTVPLLRIFDEALARAFYCDHLGFRIVFEHRFAPDLPLYAEVERDGVALHLTAHHGDCTPGSAVYVEVRGLDDLAADLASRPHPNSRPGIADMPWGTRRLTVTDPFGNRIHFEERPR